MASKCEDFTQSREDRLRDCFVSHCSGNPDGAQSPGPSQWSCETTSTGWKQLARHSRYVLPSASGADKRTAAT
eukprot:6300681-Prymnesium_polylepis.1